LRLSLLRGTYPPVRRNASTTRIIATPQIPNNPRIEFAQRFVDYPAGSIDPTQNVTGSERRKAQSMAAMKKIIEPIERFERNRCV